MSRVTEVNDETERLRSLFSSVDETKTKLVDNLLEQAAFMKVELSILQEQIRKSISTNAWEGKTMTTLEINLLITSLFTARTLRHFEDGEGPVLYRSDKRSEGRSHTHC